MIARVKALYRHYLTTKTKQVEILREKLEWYELRVSELKDQHECLIDMIEDKERMKDLMNEGLLRLPTQRALERQLLVEQELMLRLRELEKLS